MGRRSREKRARRALGETGGGADAGARRSRDMLVAAVIVAALVGLGAGWLVRMWLDRRPPSASQETSETVKERVLEKTR